MPDVVAAKRRSLKEVNAQTTRMPQPGVTKGYAYDIHTANYCTFAADLQTRSATALRECRDLHVKAVCGLVSWTHSYMKQSMLCLL